MGQSPPGDSYNTKGDGLPFMQGSAEFGVRTPTPAKWCSAPAKIAEVGDLLVSVRAPVGDTNFADQRIAIGRGLAIIRAKSETLNEYLRLVIQDRTSELLAFSGSGMFSSITAANLRAFSFPLPPLPVQHRIVDLMTHLDSHIANLQMEFETSQELMECVLVGLMTSSSSKRVPFAEAVDFKEGPGIMARDFHSEGVPLVRLAGVKPGANILQGCNYLDPALVEKKWSHFRLVEGDVILSTSASLGEVARVSVEGAGAIPYTGLIRMRANQDFLGQDFLPWVLRSRDFANQVKEAGVGSTMSHFGPSHLKQMTLSLPPLTDQTKIQEIAESWETTNALRRLELERARQARAQLLSELLSRNLVLPESYDDVVKQVA